MNTTNRTPEPRPLPWDATSGSLRCPGCPHHDLGAEDGRCELVLEGVGLHGGDDHRDALRIVRREPGLVSGPFRIPTLPSGMAAIAVIDYLERQTFDAHESRLLESVLHERFPDAIVHVWSVDGDVSHRIAEDAYLDEDEGIFVRTPAIDIAPHEYPTDVGWSLESVHGQARQGSIEPSRGYLYVDPTRPGLVRYGWQDLPGPDAGA